MITKYKTSYGNKIEKVDCVRETDKRERREAKISSYDCYFDTWEEAHEYLLKITGDKVCRARYLLERARDEYGNVKGMKRP